MYTISTITNIGDALSSLFAFMHGAVEMNYWNIMLHLGNVPSMILAIVAYQLLITLFLILPRQMGIPLMAGYTIVKTAVVIHNILLALTL